MSEAIAQSLAALDLPGAYVGLHIRGGDKVTEARLFTAGEYMDVLTDDYRNVEYLRRRYTDYGFSTLCREDERGYSLASLQAPDRDARHREYVKLLASMEALRWAERSFGSYKTNPGMFLGMRMGNRFVGIDNDRWLLW